MIKSRFGKVLMLIRQVDQRVYYLQLSVDVR